MKRWFCKLQAYVQIYKATGAYANLEGALQIKNCRKYAQQARKCIFLYQSHTQGPFIPVPFSLFLYLFSSVFSYCITPSFISSLTSLSGALPRPGVTWCYFTF